MQPGHNCSPLLPPSQRHPIGTAPALLNTLHRVFAQPGKCGNRRRLNRLLTSTQCSQHNQHSRKQLQVGFHIRKHPRHRIAIASVRAKQRISRSSGRIGQVRSIVRMIVHRKPRQQRHYRRKPDFTGDHLSPVSGRHHYRSTRTGSPVENAPSRKGHHRQWQQGASQTLVKCYMRYLFRARAHPGIDELSTAEQNQAIGRRKSRPLGAASGERREGVARPEFPACSVGDFCEGFSLPFERGFGRDDSFRRSSRGC